MILVVDSGSTKTDWALLDQNSSPMIYSTGGVNPTFQNVEEVMAIISANPDLKELALTIRKVFFFGAGCSDDSRRSIIHDALKRVFSLAKIDVQDDLKAVVLSTCGDKPGAACILGTGSNACYFDGKEIVPNNFGMGYVLADEAGGTYFGKKIITHYLYNLLPTDLADAFKTKYALTRSETIDNVYKIPHSNVWLASYASFVVEHNYHPYIKDMIRKGISEFLELYVLPMNTGNDIPVHFVGSMAFLNKEVLKEVLIHHKLKAGRILQKPIDGLATYFREKEIAGLI